MYRGADPAHDFSHISRVYKNARIIGQQEAADMQVLLLAALLHDVGSEKKHALKPGESEGMGRKTMEDFLESIGLEEMLRITKVNYLSNSYCYSHLSEERGAGIFLWSITVDQYSLRPQQVRESQY